MPLCYRFAMLTAVSSAIVIICTKEFCRCSLVSSSAAVDVIGDREQAERALAGAGGVHVQAGGLHLDGEHAHLLPLTGPSLPSS